MRTIGGQELNVLRFLWDNEPASVHDVFEHWGKQAGLARTTVLTVMERLRRKGYLTRVKGKDSLQYRSVDAREKVLNEVVDTFVRDRLGGSLAPLVAYLAQPGIVVEGSETVAMPDGE